MIKNSPLLVLLLLVFTACQNRETGKILPDLDPPVGSTSLPASSQRTSGDADEGWDFLNYGNFIGGGIPYDIFVALQADPANLLGRTGDNALIPPSFNAYDFDNGVRVVGGLTCFGCHASMLNGTFIPGLGNSLSDFTADNSGLFDLLEFAVINNYGTDSPEWEAFEPYNRGVKAVAGNIVLPFRGINPAFTLEELAAAHRNPADLSWSEAPVFAVNGNMVGSDVPPLWHIQKKNALYYTGLGRGDFAKMLQQVSIVALTDSSQAAQINQHMDDVVAWIMELEPPVYPEVIDPIQAQLGAEVFTFNCQRCHGSYGAEETYPNLLIDMDQIGTDPVYAEELMARSEFQNWYENSWFAHAPYPTETFASLGYVAPPLDGIWATAPYLHNGSVPTLYDLLNSD
ncbi:MAG: hypothetical protein KDC44_07525, partial [Phaeodactylibacter sp.]|nr:hypothetical protein [Phaeodactylibacter sp.]